jgi:ketosteroid isomerase-like protein
MAERCNNHDQIIPDVVAQWYTALATMDLEAYEETLHHDIVLNVAGRTAVSGRFHGKRTVLDVIVPRVMASLEPASVNLARRWRIMAVDGPIVVGMMEGGATTKDGHGYDQQYCQIFRVEAGVIVESWEFSDTVQAEVRLFGKHMDPGEPPTDPLLF